MVSVNKVKRYLNHRRYFKREMCYMVVHDTWASLPLAGYDTHSLIPLNTLYGSAHEVSFDYQMVYDRQDEHRDVIGFYHTHPPSFKAWPSHTDNETMDAWTRALGTSLLCFIDCGWEIKAWITHPNRGPGLWMPYFTGPDIYIGPFEQTIMVEKG